VLIASTVALKCANHKTAREPERGGREAREPRIQPEREFSPSESKQNQAKILGFPWISLDFLGFIRPNRDFSKGYEQKNKKKSTRVSGCAQNVSRALFILSSLPGALGKRWVLG
jgi:hypothetical protein